MKNSFIVFAMLLISNLSIAQSQNTEQLIQAPKAMEEAPQEETFVIVEKMPEFPGGQAALMQYLSSNIKYPEECRKMGVEGKVFVKFIVDATGNIINVQVLRGVVDGKLLEKEAMRVVQSMPKWKPGTQGGKAVSVYFTLPISFKLGAVAEEKK
jgi:periplasmic protein TonB